MSYVQTLQKEMEGSWRLDDNYFSYIYENTDLNDITTVGNYVCIESRQATTLLNCPVTTAFRLRVTHGTIGAYIQQWLCNYLGGEIWYRMLGSVDWKQMCG